MDPPEKDEDLSIDPDTVPTTPALVLPIDPEGLEEFFQRLPQETETDDDDGGSVYQILTDEERRLTEAALRRMESVIRRRRWTRKWGQRIIRLQHHLLRFDEVSLSNRAKTVEIMGHLDRLVRGKEKYAKRLKEAERRSVPDTEAERKFESIRNLVQQMLDDEYMHLFNTLNNGYGLLMFWWTRRHYIDSDREKEERGLWYRFVPPELRGLKEAMFSAIKVGRFYREIDDRPSALRQRPPLLRMATNAQMIEWRPNGMPIREVLHFILNGYMVAAWTDAAHQIALKTNVITLVQRYSKRFSPGDPESYYLARYLQRIRDMTEDPLRTMEAYVGVRPGPVLKIVQEPFA